MGETNVGSNIIPAKPEGLGGWLILVGIGILVSPVKMIYDIYNTYSDVFINETWTLLTTAGTELYNPTRASLLIFEIVVNISIIILWIYIAYLYFSKKYKFKNRYISAVLITLIVPMIYNMASVILFSWMPSGGTESIGQTIRQVIISGIWIAYILKSQRVKNTFVK